MGEKLEALWLVTGPVRGGSGGRLREPIRKVFRSREAARAFVATKRARQRVPTVTGFEVRKVTWGPEQ